MKPRIVRDKPPVKAKLALLIFPLTPEIVEESHHVFVERVPEMMFASLAHSIIPRSESGVSNPKKRLIAVIRGPYLFFFVVAPGTNNLFL